MQRVTIHEAKTHLSRLLAAVEGGEEVVIARALRPIARLVPYGGERAAAVSEKRNCIGVDESGFVVPDDFDDPLPDDILELFE